MQDSFRHRGRQRSGWFRTCTLITIIVHWELLGFYIQPQLRSYSQFPSKLAGDFFFLIAYSSVLPILCSCNPSLDLWWVRSGCKPQDKHTKTTVSSPTLQLQARCSVSLEISFDSNNRNLDFCCLMSVLCPWNCLSYSILSFPWACTLYVL